MKNKLSNFTVGITTCYAEKQLLETVRSIRNSSGVSNFPFIIVADNIPVSQYIKKELKRFNVKIIENRNPGSIFQKQKQILEIVDTEYVVFTQDDVLFGKDTLQKIIDYFDNDPELTLVGVKNTPLPPQNIIELGINVGTRLNNKIARKWHNGDNYLAFIGRVMAFRTDWIKNKMKVVDDPVSLDVYYYFLNKKLGGKFRCIWNSNLYFRNPQNLKEHLKKSSMFQNTYVELSTYKRLGIIKKEFHPPIEILIKAFFNELTQNPFELTTYVFIFLYTRLFKLNPKKTLSTLWAIDLSTKKLRN